MALSTLRKHQKKLLAILAVLAMIAFSFDIVIQTFQPSRVPRMRPIARVYGDLIYPQHIEALRQERAIANRFLALAWSAVGDTFALRVWDSEFFGPIDRDAILEAFALAREADRLGITYTDEMVTDFIVQITGGRLTQEQFRGVVSRLGVSQYTLYAALKNQLRIRLVEGLYYGRSRRLANRNRVTPYDAWLLYRQVNEQVKFEAIPVPVEAFAELVEEPSEADLRALYEKYRDRIPLPDQPEPGFRKPPRVHLQYASISVEKLVAELEKTVTDEEIKRYYEENKELYRIDEPEPEPETQPQTEETTDAEGPGQKPSEQESEKEAAQQQQQTKPASEGGKRKASATEKKQPEGRTKPQQSEPGEARSTDGDKPDAAPPAQTGKKQEARQQSGASGDGPRAAPSDQQSGQKRDDGSDKPKSEDRNSTGSVRVPRRDIALANIVAQRDPKAAKAKQQARPKVEPKPHSDERTTPDKPSGSQSSGEPENRSDGRDSDRQRADSSSGSDRSQGASTDGTADQKGEDGSKRDAGSAGTAAEAEGDSQQEKPARYQPLSEVKDAIRRILAERKAEQEAQRRLEQLAQKVREYVIEKYLPAREAYERAGGQETGKPFVPPPFPDLKPVAEELGLALHEIPELSFLNVSEVGPLRDAREVVGGVPSGAGFEQLFVPDAEGQAGGQAEVLEVRILRDLRDTYYAVWIRQRWDAETPPFEQIRDQVELAYRIQKARPLAEKRARELADELRRAGGDVKKVLAENEGLTSLSAGPMSLWRRRLGLFGPQGIEPVEIPGIEYPGDELRRTLLALEPTQVAVAPDAPVRTYYVLVVQEKVAAKLEDFAREMLLYLELAQRMQDERWVRARKEALWRPGVIELLDEGAPPEIPAQARL